MYLYMKVTDDELELPMAIADSPEKLALLIGVSPNTIRSAIWRAEVGKRKYSVYKRVEVEDE